jgi:hypothetical protein
MQCANYQEQLSEFLDGDLGSSERHDVEKHLRTCAVCSTVRDDLARLIAASANLPLHTPSQAVWTRIEREIAGGTVVAGPSAWWGRLNARRYEFSVSARQLVAAAATIVVAVGAFWAIQVASPNALPTLDVNWNSMGGPSQGVQAMPLAHVTPVDEVARLRGLVDDMARSVADTQPTWSTELKTTYLKALATADAKIAESERALASAPTDAARESTLDAYRDKLRLLDEFARLAAEARTPPAK